MIGSLRGRIGRKDAQRVLVETGGVGYLVYIPFSTFFSLGDVGSEAALLVHTHVREDALQLFGFATPLELGVFERLISVSGIGPKMSLTILSGIPAAELVAALREGDLKRLMAVPGLGRKTSERLVLELKDKFDELVADISRREPHPAALLHGPREDAVSALVNLGYRKKEAEEAVDRAAPRSGTGLEELLRAALAELAR